MGFQFNHVGGGTKTRRPITLHMKYNAACVQPNCFLITEDYGEQEVTLEELQVSTSHFVIVLQLLKVATSLPNDLCKVHRKLGQRTTATHHVSRCRVV